MSRRMAFFYLPPTGWLTSFYNLPLKWNGVRSMVSKNNQWEKFQKQTQQKPHYGIRKLTVGVFQFSLDYLSWGG